jgi:4-hydroxy-tetrahydrodipicolinate synthase
LAKKLNNQLENLHKNLFIESNPIPVKWALYKMDKCRKGIRLPLLMLSEESQPAVLNDLEELGVL